MKFTCRKESRHEMVETFDQHRSSASCFQPYLSGTFFSSLLADFDPCDFCYYMSASLIEEENEATS